jgi:uncharacterized membrane protein YdjX (TVP38/TMEM64 family)
MELKNIFPSLSGLVRKNVGKIIFILLAIVFFTIFIKFKLYVFFNYENIKAVKNLILKFSIFGPVIIFLLYIIFNIFCLPTLFFTFLSGYLFGPVYGFFIAWIGMALGFMSSFYNVRYLFRNDFIRKFGGNSMVIQLENYSQKYKGFAVLFFRVFFIIPYNMQNIAYGLSTINPVQYLWGSLVGILPTTIFYVWFGNAIGNGTISLTDFRNISGIFFIFIVFFGVVLLASLIFRKKLAGSGKKT